MLALPHKLKFPSREGRSTQSWEGRKQAPHHHDAFILSHTSLGRQTQPCAPNPALPNHLFPFLAWWLYRLCDRIEAGISQTAGPHLEHCYVLRCTTILDVQTAVVFAVIVVLPACQCHARVFSWENAGRRPATGAGMISCFDFIWRTSRRKKKI